MQIDDSADELLQQQIRSVLQLDQSRTSTQQCQQLARTMMQQASSSSGRDGGSGSTSLDDSSLLSALDQAYEQTAGLRQHAPPLPLLHSSHTGAMVAQPHAMTVITAAGGNGSLSPHHSDSGALVVFDNEARASISAVDAQLGALHESLRRFTRARIEQTAEFRATMPALAPPAPAQLWAGPPSRQAALTRAAVPAQHWMSLQQQQQQQQQLQQALQLRAPPQQRYDDAPWPDSSAYADRATAAATSIAAEPAFANHYESQQQQQQQWQRRPVQTASISVVHSPAATLARSIQPQQPLQQPVHQQYYPSAAPQPTRESLTSWPPQQQHSFTPPPFQQPQMSQHDPYDSQSQQHQPQRFPAANRSVLTHADAGEAQTRAAPYPWSAATAIPAPSAPWPSAAAATTTRQLRPTVHPQSQPRAEFGDRRSEFGHSDSRRPSYSDLIARPHVAAAVQRSAAALPVAAAAGPW